MSFRSCGSLAILGVLAACGGDAAGVTETGAGSAGTPAIITPASALGPSATPAAAAVVPATSAPTASAPRASGNAGSPAVVPVNPSAMPSGQVTEGAAAPSGAASQWCGVKQTLDGNCTVCHNEQKTAGAPMSLKKYEDLMVPAVSDPTKKVFQLVGTRVHDTARPMPPQKKLTADQLSGIDTWIAAGAPAGSDPTCAGAATAKPTQPEAAWPTDCDATYKIVAHAAGGDTQPYMVPGGQEIHPKVSVPAPWGNAAVQAIAFRSITDNPKVLHHWILYGGQREFLTGWAPGKQEIDLMGPDVGMNMSGGMLTLDMHYNNLQGTKAEPDNSGVEICVLKQEHFRKNTATVYQGFAQFAINIPPKSKGVDVTGQCTFNGTSATILTASPHAHTNARHMKFTVKRASGEVVVMHDGSFDFNEQQSYPLEKPLTLSKGDQVITTCTFDNDSDRTITFGENTGNEMCFNFAVYYPMGAMNCGGLGGARGF